MKTIHLLFGLLILMAVSLGVICLTQEVPGSQTLDHADYPAGTIQQASDGMERHRPVVVAAGCFGFLTSLFAVFCCALGLRKDHRDGIGARVLLFVGGCFAVLFSMVVIFYWQSFSGSAARVFGLPTATAWMVYVVMPSPLLLAFLYMATFSRWVLHPEDEDKFHQLVAQRRKCHTEFGPTE